MEMHNFEEDVNSCFKMAQLWHFVRNKIRRSSVLDALKCVVHEILTDDVNINYKITIDVTGIAQKHKIHLRNCTALHFVYCVPLNINIFIGLLERGADFTIKNGNNQTVLHLAITNCLDNSKKEDIAFINAVLSAHVKLQSSVNPHDNDNISHLHGACITNHVESLKLFLENGASVDEAINLDASKFAGFTPLHFAAKFNSFEAAQMLLNYEANICTKDANGMTPLDLIMEYKLDQLMHVSGLTVENYNWTKVCPQEYWDNEEILKLLLEKQCLSTVGWSRFHIACTLHDSTATKNLLNQIDDFTDILAIQSPIGPEYTALHFAAINNLDVVKMLLIHGARLDIEDANGLTPFDMCTGNYSIQKIYDTLCFTKTWNEIRLSNGKTTLLDFVRASIDLDQFKLFLHNNVKDLTIPSGSQLWPGCTILHMAVIVSTCKYIVRNERRRVFDETIVIECLRNGFDVNAQNAKNQTPIHLAFNQGKYNIVKLLLQHLNRSNQVTNFTDDDDLSYLHIACVMNEESVVEKLLQNSDPNIAYKGRKLLKTHVIPGSTPLHVAASNGAHVIAEMLLMRGAYLHATDNNGLTPIHCLLQHPYPGYGYAHELDPRTRATSSILFDSLLENLKDHVVGRIGLSYLHVACYFGHLKAVEQLLDNGSNINTAIDCDKSNSFPKYVQHYSTCTPLHMAQFHPVEQVIHLLLRRGADVYATISEQLCGPFDRPVLLVNKNITRLFFSILWDEDQMQKCMEKKMGLTKLHIACYLKNEEAIRQLLNDRINVNAPIYVNSVIFGECTPLHLLMTISPSRIGNHHNPLFAINSMLRLLLDHGASVIIPDAEKNTPIHVFHKYQKHFVYGISCKSLLLRSHQNFYVNPVNVQGVSHFHLACMWHEVAVIEKFLQHGSVDVNRPTDFFAGHSTPLHLILHSSVTSDDEWAKLSQIVDLLLKHGANVAAKDIHGDTPLHKFAVVASPEMKILDTLVRYGADVNAKNLKGQTLFDRWTTDREIDYITVLKKYDYKINSWNPLTGEGYIAKIFLSKLSDIKKSIEFEKLIQSPDLKVVDRFGRTVIHNSVANLSSTLSLTENYIYAIETFIKQGIDVDYQNESGQTALHYAARMENEPGVEALLKLGADINIIDRDGMSAFSYDMEHARNKLNTTDPCMRHTTAMLNLHLKKLQYLELEVCELNQNLISILKPILDELKHKPYFINPLDANPVRKITLDKDSKYIFEPFFKQVEMSKTVKVGVKSYDLFDFLNEVGAVTLYPHMSASERAVIDDFFNFNNFYDFDELRGIIKLQFRKMTMRLGLIEPALSSLRLLLRFSFPGLCEEIIRFLRNSDLKSLIESTKQRR